MGDVLKELQASILRVQRELRTELAWHCGIAELPDEVLLEIITLARVEIEEDPEPDPDPEPGSRHCRPQYTDLYKLASVCRRFRDIIFSNAAFWTHLDNMQNPITIDIALQRSRGANLSLTVDSDPDSSMKFLLKMQRHFSKVSSLELVFIDSTFHRLGDWQSIRDVLATIEMSDLPALERFTLRAPPPHGLHGPELFDYYDPPLQIDDDMYHVYAKGNFPCMKHLELVDMSPQAHSALSLTSIDLALARHWPRKPLTRLVSFLTSQPSLETIQLKIASMPIEDGFTWKGLDIHLPMLRTLNVRASNDTCEVESHVFDAPLIIRSLIMPAIKRIDLELTVKENGTFSMDSVFAPSRDYSSVEQLRFKLELHLPFKLQFSPFKSLFARFPNLKSLEVSFADSTLDGEIPLFSVHPPPPLEKFILEECTFIDAQSLQAILGYLRHGKEWDSFLKLTISHCPQITSAEIDQIVNEKILPRSKICLLHIDTPPVDWCYRCRRRESAPCLVNTMT